MVVVVIVVVVKVLPIFAAIIAEVLAVLLAIGTILAGRLPRLLKLRLQVAAAIGRGGPISRTGHSIA
jgi:hypothetical protein